MTTISTKYHGPSNTRGSRISVKAGNFERKYFSYDFSSNEPHISALKEYLEYLGACGLEFAYEEFTVGSTDHGIIAVFSSDTKIKIERKGE